MKEGQKNASLKEDFDLHSKKLSTHALARLRQRKHLSTSLTRNNRVLRDDEYFTDVTLATEGHSVKAHRVILSACSNYFHAILKTMRPWQHPVLVLQDVKSADLNSLMDFIYFGQVSNGTVYLFSIF